MICRARARPRWGTGDYRYLRNAMFAASATGLTLLAVFPSAGPGALTRIWIVTLAWVSVRAAFGALRVGPGVGAVPLAIPSSARFR